jgi:hypothetical protein
MKVELELKVNCRVRGGGWKHRILLHLKLVVCRVVCFMILNCEGLMNACGESKERNRWEFVRNKYDGRNV